MNMLIVVNSDIDNTTVKAIDEYKEDIRFPDVTKHELYNSLELQTKINI